MNTREDEEFRRLMQGLKETNNTDYQPERPTETIDPHPYDHLDQYPDAAPRRPRKAGLTKRGKIALGIGVTVIAGGSLIGYQIHANNEVKAQEIALKAQALEIQKMKEQNRAREAGQKTQGSQEKARQDAINTCIKSHQDQVGKAYGSSSYRDVVEGCQAQYPTAVASSEDMESAASSQTADDASGSAQGGLLIGGGALALFLVAAAKKGSKSNQA